MSLLDTSVTDCSLALVRWRRTQATVRGSLGGAFDLPDFDHYSANVVIVITRFGLVYRRISNVDRTGYETIGAPCLTCVKTNGRSVSPPTRMEFRCDSPEPYRK